jgi:hypothetical protein
MPRPFPASTQDGGEVSNPIAKGACACRWGMSSGQAIVSQPFTFSKKA